MSFVVKNTTKWRLIDLVAPHSCRGCGDTGAVLCECCKIYNRKQQQAICPLCRMVVAQSYEHDGKLVKCERCESELDAIWAVGWREGVIKELIADLKYKAVRAVAPVLAEWMDVTIPRTEVWCPEGEEVVVVPLPTIGRHVRQRGIDHTWLMGRKLAKRRGWKCVRVLGRAADTVQVGAKRSERAEQARRAYELVRKVEPGKCYVLVDDVWTTGASVREAAKILRGAGAERVYGVVVGVSK